MRDLLTTLAIFLGGILILHLVFILWKRQSRTFWITIDYVSLLLVGFSLIIASAQVRTKLMIWPLRIEEGRVQSQFDHAQWYVRQGTSFFCDNWNYKEWEDQEAVQAFQSACEWFQAMTKALGGDLESGEWRDFLSAHRGDLPDDNPVVSQSKEEAMQVLQRLQDNYDHLQEMRRDAQFSMVEDIIFVLWPSLLALSLALRVTKISAQVFGHY